MRTRPRPPPGPRERIIQIGGFASVLVSKKVVVDPIQCIRGMGDGRKDQRVPRSDTFCDAYAVTRRVSPLNGSRVSVQKVWLCTSYRMFSWRVYIYTVSHFLPLPAFIMSRSQAETKDKGEAGREALTEKKPEIPTFG